LNEEGKEEKDKKKLAVSSLRGGDLLIESFQETCDTFNANSVSASTSR
jgi:hypothetical protein